MRYGLVFLMLVLAASCGSKNYDANIYRGLEDPRGKELRVGVGDILEIKVWDQKDLNTEATVRPDGTITMPLVGDIKAAGQTPTALRDAIKNALVNYIKLAGGNEITVAVKAWKSYRFTVQGEVNRPGVYTNDEWMTVSDVLALAGGPTRFADKDSIIVMRREKGGTMKHIPVNFDLLASGKRPDMNFWVLPGDVLYIP